MFLARKGGMTFVHRGTVSAPDFTQATLTLDAAWHTLSLASIVPAGAKAVSLLVKIADNSIGSTFRLRKPGDTGTTYVWQVETVAVSKNEFHQALLGVNATPAIDYFSIPGVDEIQVYVLGWFI